MNSKIVCLAPQSHINWMFRAPLWAAMQDEFDIWHHPEPRHLAPEEALEPLRSAQGVITGWGAKVFSREVVEQMPQLKIVAHSAGSPRGLFADDTVREVLIPRGIMIYTGADGMGHNVAEATIGMMILASRRWPIQEKAYRARQKGGEAITGQPPPDTQFLSGATVGLVSASKVARQVVPLLQMFECRVLVYDPFLSPEAAHERGVEKVKLPELFAQSDIVSLHAPDLPATRGLVSAELLARMRDGATLVNTSRGRVLDHDALWRECASGRLFAALDVTEPEPLPGNSPSWDLPNVFLLPHTAGQGRAGFNRIGEGARQALREAMAGRTFEGRVPLERWETVA